MLHPGVTCDLAIRATRPPTVGSDMGWGGWGKNTARGSKIISGEGFGLILVCFGLIWRVLACFGLLWRVMACFGLFWLVLAGPALL